MNINHNYICVYCNSSRVIKCGRRRTKRGFVQVLKCKNCGRYFSENTSLEKIKLKEFLVNVCVDLRSLGLSYRNIQRHLKVVYGI